MFFQPLQGEDEEKKVYSRVEKMPVPIILLTFRKRIVMGPTLYPKGDDSSTGAPEASW
jgi:hypothetical protein